MRKNLMENKGVPLYTDIAKDLPMKPKINANSWYVISNFECDGQQLGFMWHEQLVKVGPVSLATTEFFLLNGAKNLLISNIIAKPTSKDNGADDKQLRVYSPMGELSGDSNKMKLTLTAEEGKVNVTLTPKKEVLYNGTTGLINLGFLSRHSYQFAFPNMDIQGTVTIKGKEYPIKNTTAWFDRQWGESNVSLGNIFKGGESPQSLLKNSSWLWLGLTLNNDNSEAISLWDFYEPGERHAFATVIKTVLIQLSKQTLPMMRFGRAV